MTPIELFEKDITAIRLQQNILEERKRQVYDELFTAQRSCDHNPTLRYCAKCGVPS